MRVRPGVVAIAIVAALASSQAIADALPRLTPQDAYAAVAAGSDLRRVAIEGDLDVAKMTPPAGSKRILLQDVKLDGRLGSSAGGGPSVALEIDRSELRDVDFRGTRFTAPLVIEASTISERAFFDEAQFDQAFVLHGSAIDGQAQFRRARFAASVEITSSVFRPAPPLRAAVSFADARFAGPARFDRSNFATGVRFDSARFAADASFLGLEAAGPSSWRNAIFEGDAEFRFCRLGEADFGDIEQMSVFMQLADFRGCRMTSLRLDYADMRGDALLVNVRVSPGDLTAKEAFLRGGRSDFSGLQVDGKLDLRGARIANLELRWPEIAPALLRSEPGSDVLRPLQRRLEDLKKDDEAREASAVLADVTISERLARPDASPSSRAMLWLERIVWGGATGYGTRLDRILGVALLVWLVLGLPLLLARGARIGRVRAGAEKAPALHEPVAPDALQPPTLSAATRSFQRYAYAFALMFAVPDLGLRPAEPISGVVRGYLLFLRVAGLGLIVLLVLTLTKVSPIMQAVIGKVVG